MSALPLPGGLAVRECSPVVDLTGTKGIVVAVESDWSQTLQVSFKVGPNAAKLSPYFRRDLTLDLTHETGLQHAARYCFENGPKHLFQDDYLVIYDAACQGKCDVKRLREIVLEVAALVARRKKEAAIRDAAEAST